MFKIDRRIISCLTRVYSELKFVLRDATHVLSGLSDLDTETANKLYRAYIGFIAVVEEAERYEVDVAEYYWSMLEHDNYGCDEINKRMRNKFKVKYETTEKYIIDTYEDSIRLFQEGSKGLLAKCPHASYYACKIGREMTNLGWKVNLQGEVFATKDVYKPYVYLSKSDFERERDYGLAATNYMRYKYSKYLEYIE